MSKSLEQIALEYLENNAGSPIVYISADGNIKWVNRTARELGILPDRPATDFFVPEDLQKALKGEPTLVFPKKLDADQEVDLVPYFDVHPFYDGNALDGVLLVSGVWKMLNIFDSIDMGMLVCDEKGNIIMFNRMAAILLGDFIHRQKNLFGILENVISDKSVLDEIKEKLDEGKYTTFSVNVPHKGIPRTLAFHIFYIVNGSNGARKYYVKVFDITELSKCSDRKMHILKQEFLERFSSNIFHKFNNQFLLIMADAGLIRRKLPPVIRSQLASYLDKMEEHIMAASETVELLSLFVRAPRQAVHKVDILEHLEKYINNWIEKYGGDVEVLVELPDIYAPVNAYTSLLDRIFDAVLDNALRAIAESGRAGRISITAEVIRPDEIFLSHYPELSSVPHIKITVADTGCGIKKEFFSRIFEPFFSGWKIPSRGLGLSVALSSIRHHGGTIDVKSQEGVGTTVSLFFPLSEVGEITYYGYEREEPAPAERRGKTILVVDDDEDVQEALTNMLDSLGFDVVVASNAAEGVDLFGKAQPDAVILDMILPKVGGEVVYKKIMEIAPDVPVIVATAYAQIETVEELIESGVRYILQKPFTMGQLASVLDKLFPENKR